jgi:hypothetical protein
VTGLQIIPFKLTNFYQKNLVEKHTRIRKLLGIAVQGLIIVAVLVECQSLLNENNGWYMSYLPPIGFAFFIAISFLIQPILIGVLNVLIINKMCKCKGWQVNFWLNGIFLLLIFMTANLMLQTVLELNFFYVATVDFVALSFPFGFIARYSNGGWKKPMN